ncbi:rod shape-determining protein MreC [candidate division KSB1 bacterium]|nr:rod shape-determining protein MreC [candidate division KSB1 bacterium]
MNTSYKDYIALFFTITISLILIYSNENRQIQTFRMSVLDGTGWLQKQVYQIKQLKTLKAENERLLKQNAIYSLKLIEARDALYENDRLKALLNFKMENQYDLVTASVVSRGLTRNVNTVVINRGQLHGIKRNMPVVNDEGLIGKIFTVGKNYALVHILPDPNFRVSARIQRSRINGILSWEKEGLCSLTGIPQRADVQLNDLIITSGYSSIFPKGIMLGKVIFAADLPDGLFKRVLVVPIVNFERIEEVLVILTSVQNNVFEE